MPLIAPPPIETPRLTLRPVEEADLPALLEVNGEDAVTRFLPYATWQHMADAQAWYQRVYNLHAAGAAVQFVAVERRSRQAIGSCLLFRFEEGSARAEVGYVLGRPHWGQGYMSEAIAALVCEAFGQMGLRRLEAEVDIRNSASSALLQRVGFQREGLLRQRWVTQGEARDVHFYGLLVGDWLRLPMRANDGITADAVAKGSLPTT